MPLSPPGPAPSSRQASSFDARERGLHVEPQRVRRALRDQLPALVRWQRFRGARIERRPVGIARPGRVGLALRHQTGDFRAALETRIDQAQACQFFDRLPIARKMFRLPPHRRFPGYPQPGEVLIDRRLEFRPAPGRVDVLDPQQEPSPRAARQVEVQQRRIGVTEMEVAVRAWCKSENGWRHHAGPGISGLPWPPRSRRSTTAR